MFSGRGQTWKRIEDVLKLQESNPTAQAHPSRIPNSAPLTGLTDAPLMKGPLVLQARTRTSQGTSGPASHLCSGLLLLPSCACLAPGHRVWLPFTHPTFTSVSFPILHTLSFLLPLDILCSQYPALTLMSAYAAAPCWRSVVGPQTSQWGDHIRCGNDNQSPVRSLMKREMEFHWAEKSSTSVEKSGQDVVKLMAEP